MLREACSELTCGCCFGLLVEPTALACGHTFCRHCLATWTVTSGKRLCPTCREEWRGSPRVNIILRNMLQETWSQTLADRMQEVNTDENLQFISAFDNMTTVETHPDIDRGSQAGTPRDPHEAFVNRTRLKFLASGAAVASLVFCFLWKFDEIRSQRTLIETQIKQWDTDDVVEWMGQLGPWADRYHEDIKTNNIDGKMLLVMQESDVRTGLNMTNELQRKVFLKELAAIATTGSKQPVNLWEYKSAYPAFALYMLLGFQCFPRITIGYIYIFEYDTVYTPFMIYACSEFTDSDMESTTRFFRVFYTAFLPYWLVGRYASTWSSDHYWVSRFVVMNCVLATIVDVMLILTICMKKWTEKDVNNQLSHCRDMAIVLAVSVFLPWFLFNFLFYYSMMCLPIFYVSHIYIYFYEKFL